MNDDLQTAERKGSTKKLIHRRVFATDELEKNYAEHCSRAQDLFLAGSADEAMTHAVAAIKLHPTAQLFLLMSSICEMKGNFEKASEFRMLQAFLSNDASLWEELLNDCLTTSQFYKASVCLHRLVSLTSTRTQSGKKRYRELQLLRADLLVGLGEFSRATTIYVDLWNGSKCRDFEVFANLSSLLFQRGRLAALDRLITTSMLVFKKRPATTSKKLKAKKKKKVRKSETLQAAGTSEDAGGTKQEMDHEKKASEDGDDVAVPSKPDDSQEEGEDDEGVEDKEPSEEEAEEDLELVLDSADAKRNFTTLTNVKLELLLEKGHFQQVIDTVFECASQLGLASTHDLHPDLLSKQALAYAYLGDKQSSESVTNFILEHCPFVDFGDVLFDLGESLLKLGYAEFAARLFTSLLSQHDNASEAARRERLLLGEDQNDEESERNSTRVALLLNKAKSDNERGAVDEAMRGLHDLRTLDSGNTAARIELAKILIELHNYPEAEELLLARADDDPFQAVLLAAELAQVYFKLEKYLNAIAVGVGIFELLLQGDAEGDTESVVAGAPSTRKRGRGAAASGAGAGAGGGSTYLPSVVRASSAIVPTSSLRGAVDSVTGKGFGGSAAAASSLGLLTPSQSIATSFRASTVPRSRATLSQQGAMTMTSTAAGAATASVVASTAAGGAGGRQESYNPKDASALFRFNRKRKKAVGDTETAKKAIHDRIAAANNEKKKQAHQNQHPKDVDDPDRLSDDRGSVGNLDDLEEMEEHMKATATTPAAKEREEGDASPKKKRRVHFAADHQEVVAEVVDAPHEDGALQPALLEEAPPSLEHIAQSFGDDTFAQLFLTATEGKSSGSAGGGGGPEAPAAQPPARSTGGGGAVQGASINNQNPNQQLQPQLTSGEQALMDAQARAMIQTHAERNRAPTGHEILTLIGRAKIVSLAVMVVEAYNLLGQFQESKQFAGVVLRGVKDYYRRQFQPIVAPLRLALLRTSIHGGHYEDATKYAVAALAADPNAEEIWTVLAVMAQTGNEKTSIVRRLITDQGRTESVLLGIQANRYFQAGSYRHSLSLFLFIHARDPECVITTLMVGLSYLFVSQGRTMSQRHEAVESAFIFLERYRFLSVAADPSLEGETVYNIARAYHYLGLHYLAVPLYEKVLAMETDTKLPCCSEGVKRAAAFNLAHIFRTVTKEPALADDVYSRMRPAQLSSPLFASGVSTQ